MTNLKDYLKKKNIKQRDFAAMVDVSPSFLNEIIKGVKTPGLSLAFRIQRQTSGKVKAEQWAVEEKGAA